MTMPQRTAEFESSGWGAGSPSDTRRRAPAGVVGLWVLLAVISSFFLLLAIAFFGRAQYPDWDNLAAPWNPLANPWHLWLNTGLLACACIAMQWSAVQARAQALPETRLGLGFASLFTLAFLAGQLWLWSLLVERGYNVSSNPANSFFYLLTGVHGAHVLGGLVALGRSIARSRRPTPAAQALSMGVRLCAVYWHFLFGVWLLLLVLLSSPPDRLAAIAAFCGF